MQKDSTLYLKDNGPFYDLIRVYQTLFVGLTSVFVPQHRLNVTDADVISWGSKSGDNFFQHINQIIDTANANANLDDYSFAVSGMLMNLAYEKVKEFNDESPEFEFFRHVRNASSHNNKFYFKHNQPNKPAYWRKIVVDHNLKGQNNPLFEVPCFGGVMGSADVFYLLSDIEAKLPAECFQCSCCM